jgi:transcription elongation factor GreB
MAVNYLSPESFERMKKELAELLRVERPKIVASVTAAAAMGDRSENAEYIYGKRRLREIDRRVRFLQQRIEASEVVDATKLSLERVAFGLSVELEDEAGEVHTYTLIGPDDPSGPQSITYRAPLGRALLGKKVGDEIVAEVPKGRLEFTLIRIFLGQKK